MGTPKRTMKLSFSALIVGMAAATTMLQGIGEKEVSFSSLNIDAPLHHTAKLVLSSGDKRYTMGAFPTGEFMIKKGESKAVSVSKDGALNVFTPVLSTGDLDVATSVTLSGAKQWKLVSQENFDKGALGWSNDTTTTCGGYALLGGFGQFAGGEVKKTFANLTEHTQVRVVATFSLHRLVAGRDGLLPRRRLVRVDGPLRLLPWHRRHKGQYLRQDRCP